MPQETVLTREQADEVIAAMRAAVNSVPVGLKDSRETKQDKEEQDAAA